MFLDSLAKELYDEIVKIPLIDPHTHINPHAPASKTLDDILGYHYYTELAHSAGMDKAPLQADVSPRDRVKAILGHMDRFDNTVQYSWFLEIAREFLGYEGDRLNAADADMLFDKAESLMAQPDWEDRVLKQSGLEKVFLTNDFDDSLDGFDTDRYIPCLRTDDLVFHLGKSEVRERLAKATGIEVDEEETGDLRKAIGHLFEHFTKKGARACAISLPPNFSPRKISEVELTKSLRFDVDSPEPDVEEIRSSGIFWILAEQCREHKLPFDLMIGVNRRVYRDGVFQGQDLFDQRTSLIQYAELFNAFPEVTFPISVLSSSQNQELVSYSWIFPNVVTSGHWWYSNIPVAIERDTKARLQAVPKTKQLGYYSDMYKLEFALPKYNMYRRVLARVLADDFVRSGVTNERGAVALAKQILRDNVEAIFNV